MRSWPVQDAKARFSELLEKCMTEGPQMVTKCGADAAVLVPVKEWHRLHSAAQPSLKELLTSDKARIDNLVPARGSGRRRSAGAKR